MTDEDRLLLDELKSNTQQLFAEYEEVTAEKELLNKRVLELQNEIGLLREAQSKLSQKYENLKLAKQMESRKSDDSEAKKRINKLVREIDKCIALLNK